MYDLSSFSQANAAECGNGLQAAASGAGSMEDAANRIVSHLYDNLTDPQTGARSCALVRFYKTHPYTQLDSGLQEFARGILGGVPDSPNLNCLTMLATTGDQPAWNSRAQSQGHKAIPLASEQMVAGIPMIARLLGQFGLDVNSVMQPDPSRISDMAGREYDTFYVPDAQGSPYIPAQDEFVIPFGIRSVLAFGGVLGSGELYVVIMFSKVAIPQQTADNFKAVAPGVKAAVQGFVGGKVFA